uniref:Putative secreted protein n=1 Tax=Anopheles marajoara TaxID=58244 RepID=A0A2M4C6N6_9DIPT
MLAFTYALSLSPFGSARASAPLSESAFDSLLRSSLTADFVVNTRCLSLPLLPPTHYFMLPQHNQSLCTKKRTPLHIECVSVCGCVFENRSSEEVHDNKNRIFSPCKAKCRGTGFVHHDFYAKKLFLKLTPSPQTGLTSD